MREPGAEAEPSENLSTEVISWPILANFKLIRGGMQPTIRLFLQERVASARRKKAYSALGSGRNLGWNGLKIEGNVRGHAGFSLLSVRFALQERVGAQRS